MKKKADEYLYNEALKYLGKYPATKKKISEILEKDLSFVLIVSKYFTPFFFAFIKVFFTSLFKGS